MPSEIPNSEVSASEDPMSKSTRLVTLQRSEAVISLGFSIRGGIEHGLGHFVSSVEPDSEAHRQGLRPGDEVLTVCGLPILGATHKEVVNFISSRWKVVLTRYKNVLI
jgi:C-terminal processing protease CtpA/Prc